MSITPNIIIICIARIYMYRGRNTTAEKSKE
jgi:hypothetical protein